MTQFLKEGLTFSLVIFAAFLSGIRNLISPSKLLSLFLLLQTIKQGFQNLYHKQSDGITSGGARKEAVRRNPTASPAGRLNRRNPLVKPGCFWGKG